MKKKLITIPLISALILFSLFAFKNPLIDKDYWLEYITNHLEQYVSLVPQQKVYLQFDRDEYEVGSTIWFKAYILNATDKKPENRSRNLYIEVISPTKEVFMHRLLKIRNGFAHGDFPVHDTVSTGLYSIRAYTRNMKNYGKEYLFNRDIRIIHPEKVYYTKEFYKKAKKISKKKDKDIDLQFFPEGGDLVNSLKNTLAFKAIDQNGEGIDVEGKIYAKKGAPVCDFKTTHIGMGKIELEPKYGEKYYAVVKSTKGKKYKFDLPGVLKEGYSLSINSTDKQIQVVIKTNKEFGNDPVAKTIYLFVQNGGKIYSSGKHSFKSNEIKLNIGKKNFPSGVLHFTLFDGYGKPQCERLAFVDHHYKLNIKPNLDVKKVGKRQKVEFDIEVTDGEYPVEANLSLAVRNKSQVSTSLNKSMNIYNYMLLQADLKGNIENPEYYFGGTLQQNKDLDLLLLTQGWRKFAWKDILQDSIPFPEFPVETDLRITGRITKYFFDISAKEANVKLTILNKYNDVYKDITSKKGRFEFTNLDYNDTLDVLIEARSKWNRKNILILVDEDREIGNDFNPFREFYIDSLVIKRKIIYPKWKEPEPDPNKPMEYKLHDRASNVVKMDKPEYSSYSSLPEALKGRIPGVNFGDNGTTIRGINTFLGNTEPLYLLDGVPVDYSFFKSININDVERIEVLKGPDAAIYGIRGANGVIAVYTKRGFYMKRGEINFKMLGYHTPKVFYSPKYEPSKNDPETPDLRKTVYWNPGIKTNKNGKAHVSFYQSDIVDDFEIIIEGMDYSGNFGYAKYEYTVNEVN